MDVRVKATNTGVLFQEMNIMVSTIFEEIDFAPGWLLGTENFIRLFPKESRNLTLLSLELTSMPTSNEVDISITSFQVGYEAH